MTRSARPMSITLVKPLLPCVLALAVAAGVVGAIVRPLVGQAADPPAAATTEPDNAQDDAQEGAGREGGNPPEPRWRRAIFELGEWLSVQKIYPPREVQRIKAEFNTKVMKMSPQEIEYLLDDLEAKFKVIETPEAQEARAWMGQYLSAMSDRKRADVLKDVPNVVDMTAAQLSEEIFKIEQTRQTLKDRQVAFDAGKQVLADVAAANRKATADASLAATAQMNSSPSYSPYRSGGSGGAAAAPSPTPGPAAACRLGSVRSGAYVGMSLGNF